MGKEIVKRPNESEATSKVPSSNVPQHLNNELFVHWTKYQSPALAEDLKENGRVVVIIRDHSSDINLMCTGYNKEGNPFIKLMNKFIAKGLIRHEMVIRNVLLLKPTMWTSVDVKTATFNSNDHILIIVGDKIPEKTEDKKLVASKKCDKLMPKRRNVIRKIA